MKREEESVHFRREAKPTLEAVAAAAEGAPEALRPLLDRILVGIFDTDFTVAALQRELGLADDLLLLFHRVMGIPVARYIQHARLETAARLFRNTPLSAEAVAWWVGYSDARALRRAFKDWSGHGPEAYSRMMALAMAIDRLAATFADKTGAPVRKTSPDDTNDVFQGWTLVRREELTRWYELATLDAVRRFAYRIARLAEASGPHQLQLRYDDGLLTVNVWSAVDEKLTAKHYRLMASIDAWYRKLFESPQ